MQDQYTALAYRRMGAEEARALLIAEFGDYCLRCGFSPPPDSKPLAVDHIIPVARGGKNRYGNYQLLCPPCNSWKGVRAMDFRPGPPRGKIPDDLPIIPNEERVRKGPIRAVPDPVPPVPAPPPEVIIKEIQVPIMVPVPPMPHDCYKALPNLFSAYEHATREVASISLRLGRAESAVTYGPPSGHGFTCSPLGCVIVPSILFVVTLALAIYFYIH